MRYASGNGISLTTEILPPVPLSSFDPARILQVLSNLLSNAIKFTPAQGAVVVSLEHVEDNIVCRVRDSGEQFSRACAARLDLREAALTGARARAGIVAALTVCGGIERADEDVAAV